MPDAIYAHPRLAPLYDAFDGDRDDLVAYLAIVDELGARRILDVGCGTGNLAVLLADRGCAVVGVDPAAASLEVAMARDEHKRVTWVHGESAAVRDRDLDLAVMTANVADVFVTDADWTRNLAGISAALRPGGHLVFESRRPQRRVWEDWASDTAVVVRDVPGVGRVEHRREVTDVSLPLVTFRATFRFLADGTEITSVSTLRFRDRDETEASLAGAGYRVLDVRDAPDRAGRENVYIAQLAC